MKVLQLIQKSQLRGAEMFASQLSNHLLEQGHDVKMVCLFSGIATLPFFGDVIVLNRPSKKRFVDIEGWRQLAHIIEDFQPDIIQANAGDTLKFAVFSKLVFRWKAALVFRNANKVSDFINSSAKLVFNRFLVNRVSHVISVSELCRQDFVKTYSYPQQKTVTIPIGVEPLLPQEQLPEELRAAFVDHLVLIHAASFVPEKNHAGLIRIVKSLRNKKIPVKLMLLGDGRLRPQIEKLVDELGLMEYVLFLGYRNDVLTLMQHAHGFVLPSFIEGLPGVILEAMWCKIPVVAYNVGGISEVIQSNTTGWLIPKGDEPAFTAAVEELFTDKQKRERLVQNAFNLVSDQYTNHDLAKRFANVYQKVIKKTVK